MTEHRTTTPRRDHSCCFSVGWCSALFDLVNDAVFIHDAETGAILDVNRRAEEMFGATRDELRALGTEAFSEGRPPYTGREAFDHLRAAAAGTPQIFEWRARSRRGDLFWVEVNIKNVAVEDGNTLVAVVRDITNRKIAEQLAEAREADLRVAQRIAHVGSWSWTVGTDTLEASEEVCRIYGRDPSVPLPASGSEQFRRHYTPEGWQRREEAFRKALAEGQSWEREEQILRLDGSVRWVRFRGEPERDCHDRIVKLRGTVQDITEQKRAADALREADRRKDEFLGMLSHELRNPLAPIRNSIYILRHAHTTSAQAARALNVIGRQTEHLTRLVDDLLDVTRIARGKIELRRVRVDLRQVVLRAAEDFRMVMGERGSTFATTIPEQEVWADVDPVRVTQVIGNLLHNAAKFTCAGDHVTLALTRAAQGAEIRVRDTGAGIDPELLPRVFEPFVQGDRTLARTEGGLGLGLALVKGIADLHGGEARVESGGRGKGAEFILTFPASPAAVATGSPPTPQPRSRGRRVLAVDDNRDSADSMAEIVRMLGHEADVAYDGPSAVSRVRAGGIDAVLCDIGLPGMSGYDVARIVRAEGSLVQLVALSGYAQPDDVARAIEAGFDAHVAKPGDVATIQRLLA